MSKRTAHASRSPGVAPLRVQQMDNTRDVLEEQAGSRPEHAGQRDLVESPQQVLSDSSARTVEALTFSSETDTSLSRNDAGKFHVAECVNDVKPPSGEKREASSPWNVEEHQDSTAMNAGGAGQSGNDGVDEAVDEQSEKRRTDKRSPEVLQIDGEAVSFSEQDVEHQRSTTTTDQVQQNARRLLDSEDGIEPVAVVAAHRTEIQVGSALSGPQRPSIIQAPAGDMRHRYPVDIETTVTTDTRRRGRQSGSGHVRPTFSKKSDCFPANFNEVTQRICLPSPITDSADQTVFHPKHPRTNEAPEEVGRTEGQLETGLAHNGLRATKDEGSKASSRAPAMLPQNRSPHLKEKLRIFEDISRSSRFGSRPLRSVSTSRSCSTRAEGVRQVLSRFRSATARSQQEPQKRFQAAVLDKEEQIKKLKRVLKHRDETVRELQDTMTKKEEDACYLLNEKLKLCHDLLTKRTEQENQSTLSAAAALISAPTTVQQNSISNPLETDSEGLQCNKGARPNEQTPPTLPDFHSLSRKDSCSVDGREPVTNWSACGTKEVEGNECLPLKDKLELFEAICKQRGYDNRAGGPDSGVRSAWPTPSHSPKARGVNGAMNHLFAEKEEELRSLQEEVKKREQLIAVLQKAVSAKDVELAEVLQQKFSLSRNVADYLAKGRDKVQRVNNTCKLYRSKHVTCRSGAALPYADNDCIARSASQFPDHFAQQRRTTLSSGDSFTHNNGECADARSCKSDFTTDISQREEKHVCSPDRKAVHGVREPVDVLSVGMLPKEQTDGQNVAQVDCIFRKGTDHQRNYRNLDIDFVQKDDYLQKPAAVTEEDLLHRVETAAAAGAYSEAVCSKEAAEGFHGSSTCSSPRRNRAFQACAAGAAEAGSAKECRAGQLDILTSSQKLKTLGRGEVPSHFQVGYATGGDKDEIKCWNWVEVQQSPAEGTAEAGRRNLQTARANEIILPATEASRTTALPEGNKREADVSATCVASAEEGDKNTNLIPIPHLTTEEVAAPDENEATAIDAPQTISSQVEREAAGQSGGNGCSEKALRRPPAAHTSGAQQSPLKRHTPVQPSSNVGEGVEDLSIAEFSSCGRNQQENKSVASANVSAFTQRMQLRPAGWNFPIVLQERQESCSTYDLQLQVMEDARGCPGACTTISGDKFLEKGSEISASKAQAKRKIESLHASACTPSKWKTLSALNGETVAEVFFEVLLGQMETRIENVLNEAVSSVLDLPDQFSKTLEAYNEIKTMQEEIRSLRLENESLRRSLKRTPFQMRRPSEGEASVTVQRQPEAFLQKPDTVSRNCTGIKEVSAPVANRQASCRRSADAGAVKVGIPPSKPKSPTQLQYLNSCIIISAKDVQSTLTEEMYSITERELVTTGSRYSIADEDALENAESVVAGKEQITRLKEEVKQLSQKCRYLEELDAMTWRRIQQRVEYDNRARLRLKARYSGAYTVLKTKLHKTQKRRVRRSKHSNGGALALA